MNDFIKIKLEYAIDAENVNFGWNKTDAVLNEYTFN
jgi:hypothetical protein